MENVEISVKELREVFECIEELQQFLHRPEISSEELARFLDGGAYKKLHHAFYDIVWNWLPPEIQREYENR